LGVDSKPVSVARLTHGSASVSMTLGGRRMGDRNATPARDDDANLANLLIEERRFPPSPDFAAQANVGPDIYEAAAADTQAFWATQARKLISWETDFSEVLDWSGAPVARWFGDGRLNAAYNALDRHVEAGLGDRVAIHFE